MHKRSIAGPSPFEGKMHLLGVYSVGEVGG